MSTEELINTKFRRKSLDVEAIRFRYAEYADNPLTFEAIPDWLQSAIDDGTIKPVFKGEDYWYLEIRIPEGFGLASPGDWLVRMSDGIVRCCTNEVFTAVYEPAAAAVPAVEAPETGA